MALYTLLLLLGAALPIAASYGVAAAGRTEVPAAGGSQGLRVADGAGARTFAETRAAAAPVGAAARSGGHGRFGPPASAPSAEAPHGAPAPCDSRGS